MKCFIASAFGHDDVDAVYDQCIIPVLNKLRVTPLRVDRIVHNEDIDNKIFELLDSSDIVIADITYARPSVYYEAGYAVGKGIPVVYTVRGDHFHSREDDPQGNLRVHFDLQMKNIIPWDNPDQVFSNTLERRMQRVLEPLVKVKDHQLLIAEARVNFASLSISDRLQLIHTTGTDLFKKQSFKPPEKYIRGYTEVPGFDSTFLYRSGKTSFQWVGLFSMQSALKKFLLYVSYDPLFYSPEKGTFNFVEAHYIVACLNSLPQSRISQNIQTMRYLNEKTLYRELPHGARNVAIPRKIYIHIIDKIKSRMEFLATLDSIKNEYGLSKNANY